LRGVLRQDPDVVLVGEIRDGETANIATEAALTGHLVLSSLHTNDSIQAITRLLELGVEAHMVAPTIVGILSQRLVRRVCSACKESYTASTAELEPFFENPGSSPVTLYRGKGCTRCFGTGYSGRTGVHEYLEVSEEMRDLIISHAPPSLLVAEAKNSSYKPMRYDALKKALLGWTTLDEVEKNTLPETKYR
jgi:type II secretory ATPase GspE/PulE/Tfp pilus assembly ATPase PilB-like protein